MKYPAALLVLLAGIPLLAHAQAPGAVRTEVSKDGRMVVHLWDESDTGVGWSARSDAVPFGTTPDWSLDLRRQVGVVRIADMNGDGRNDLVVGCYISSSFPPYTDWHDMIFSNTGTTLEATPSWVSADQVHTGDAQVGDINLDGAILISSSPAAARPSPIPASTSAPPPVPARLPAGSHPPPQRLVHERSALRRRRRRRP
jgi:hypothetical protein